jgi:hypothetical protein
MITLELLNGIVFGVEHLTGEDEDEFEWVVVIHLSFFRLVFLKLK